jgi:phenylpropionate dioxygenase-like ring-hydroxylating dioxygenase large terminal subunit
MTTPGRVAEDHSVPADGVAPFLRNAWYLAGWVAELPQQGLTSVSLLGESIVLFRPEPGAWAALEDVCYHRLVPLSLGRQENDCVRCLYHGLKFARDGRCVEIPGQERISPAARVRTYPVKECRGGLWVWMGLPGRADESQIPLIPGMDDPTYAVACSSIDIEANASLIWDNLNDLSHVPFVHASTFAAGDPAVVASMIAGETQLDLQVLERGVRTTKWHAGRSHPFFAERCDDFLISEFVAPGALLITVRSYKAGAKERQGGEPPVEELLWQRVASQVVSPVSETRSRIFFSVGSWRRAQEYVARQLAVAKAALAEDKLFIDAQQVTMRRLPHRKPMALSMDVGVVRFRSVMKRLRESDIE